MSSPARFSAVIPGPRPDTIIVEPLPDGGYGLPTVDVEPVTTTGQQVTALAQRYPVAEAFLRHIAYVGDETSGRTGLAEFERSADTDRPYLPLADIDRIQVPDDAVAALRHWAAEQRGAPIPALRPAWARPGWYRATADWIAERLSDLGIEAAGEPTVVQQWAISAVLCQPSSAGDHYLKAVFGSPGRGFWHEPKLTRALAAAHPGTVPKPVATDDDRGLLLMADMELAAEGSDRPTADLADVLRALATVHRHWIGQADRLSALGCPDRHPKHLVDQIRDALADQIVSGALDSDERRRLADLLPDFGRLCDRAAEWPVPTTLVHGDFHAGNVGFRSDGTACIYDWSDGALSHPFFDIAYFVTRMSDADKSSLWDTYLEQWRDVAPVAELRRAIPAATVLNCLYQVVTYRGIVTNLDATDRFVFASSSGGWWRRALAAWDAMADGDAG